MRGDKYGMRMFSENVMLLGDQRFPGWQPLLIITAIRMGGYFKPSFVIFIQGVPETFRIGRMYQYRNVEFAAFFPNGIKPRIINADKLILLILKGQTEILVNLQPAGSG